MSERPLVPALLARAFPFAALLATPTACNQGDAREPAFVPAAYARILAADVPIEHDGDVEFRFATPILRVQDLGKSLDYYVHALGFKQDWTWGDPPTFASVSRGHVAVFFCEQCQGHAGTWLTVFVDDVDRLYVQYKKSGAQVLRPPQDETWGLREMLVRDPDGHVLRLGHGIGHDGRGHATLAEP